MGNINVYPLLCHVNLLPKKEMASADQLLCCNGLVGPKFSASQSGTNYKRIASDRAESLSTGLDPLVSEATRQPDKQYRHP